METKQILISDGQDIVDDLGRLIVSVVKNSESKERINATIKQFAAHDNKIIRTDNVVTKLKHLMEEMDAWFVFYLQCLSNFANHNFSRGSTLQSLQGTQQLINEITDLSCSINVPKEEIFDNAKE